jgi:manganese efflux pump family protein
MMRIVLLGVLAGLDNLQVAAAISMAPLARSRRVLYALSFCVCEISTPLIGLLFMRVVRPWFNFAPFILLACGAAIVVLAFTDRDDLEKLVNHRWTIAAVPLSLSIDNLLIGVSIGAIAYPLPLAAVTIGLVSAGMCLFGIAGGMQIRKWIPAHANVISGLYLIVCGATMFLQ